MSRGKGGTSARGVVLQNGAQDILPVVMRAARPPQNPNSKLPARRSQTAKPFFRAINPRCRLPICFCNGRSLGKSASGRTGPGLEAMSDKTREMHARIDDASVALSLPVLRRRLRSADLS